MSWHLLQVSDALDLEFASALSERVALTAWQPTRRAFCLGRGITRDVSTTDPPVHVRTFPLQRGFTIAAIEALSRTGARICDYILQHRLDDEVPVLICTAPYFASVAERWPGPVVYWLTDRIECYEGANPQRVRALDRRLCAVATLVCPNSQRLARYLEETARCPPSKLLVLPNATRASNLLATPSNVPAQLPADIADIPRPIAGVIGNMADNVDWHFVEELMRCVPSMRWVFIGPTEMRIPDRDRAAARKRVMRSPQARFTGWRAFGALAAYARSFDIAILPYHRHEPTYSGSSTRFYEHLAAGRPMIATRGFEELLHKEPLLRLVKDAEDASNWMETMRTQNFDDGLSFDRWQQSHKGTWQHRADTLLRALYPDIDRSTSHSDLVSTALAS